jgi:hypothetical protein
VYEVVDATQEQIKVWLKNPFILRNIREIMITGDHYRRHWGRPTPTPEQVAAKWVPLVQLVKKATRLTKIRFDYGGDVFPLELLEALEKFHPQVKLFLTRYHRDDELDHTDAAECALSRSPILMGIRTSRWFDGGGSDIDLRLAAFQRIVKNAPNLHFASIVQGHSGCVLRYQSSEGLAREHKAAAKFFSHDRGPNTSVRFLTLDGFPVTQETLEEWGQYVSLPHLETLKFTRGMLEASYFEVAPTLLTNLKHVSLNFTNLHRDPNLSKLIDRYISSCSPLETLSLWSWIGLVSLDTILQHGPTLRTLQLHERETLELDKRRGLFSVEDVRRIRDECPLLEELTIDMDRDDPSWKKDIARHKKMLKEIAEFGKNLRKVQIYLDLGVANEVAGMQNPNQSTTPSKKPAKKSSKKPSKKRPRKGKKAADEEDDDTSDIAEEEDYRYRGPFPPISRDEMKEHGIRVWKVIFGDPENKGPRELDIKWGEYERKRGSGYPAPWVIWERNNSKHVVVRPEERDDMPGEAFAKVYKEGRREDSD